MNPKPHDHLRTGQRPNWKTFAPLALCIVCAAGLGFWMRATGARVGALTAQESALSAEWKAVSVHLQEAAAMRPKLERALGRPAQIAADRARPRWSPALRDIAMAVGGKVEILEIHSRGNADDTGACEMRVRGVVAGSQPRQAGDRFREAVEDHLKDNANGRPVSARFEQFKIEPAAPGTLSDEGRGAFILIAAVGPVKHLAAISREGR